MERAPVLHAEALLFLRVLLARVSAEHLPAVWPVVNTQLTEVFRSGQPVALPLLLAACKFLDAAMCLHPGVFSLFQWMYLPGLSAARRGRAQAEAFEPELLGLCQRVQADVGAVEAEARAAVAAAALKDGGGGGALRQPVLTMRAIAHEEQLGPFFEHVQVRALLCVLSNEFLCG